MHGTNNHHYSNLTAGRSQPGFLSSLNRARGARTSFHPEIQALAHAAELDTPFTTVPEEDVMAMAEHLAARLDPLLRSIELKEPHLPLRPGQPLDPTLKSWVNKNAKSATKLHKVTGRDIQFTISNLLQALGLAGVDPRCGGLILAPKGYEALVDPRIYVDSLLAATPPVEDRRVDLPLALVEALISYVGVAKTAAALGVRVSLVADEFHRLTHEANVASAFTAHIMNNISRHVLGLQYTPMWKPGSTDMTPVGSLVYKYGLSKALIELGF